MASSAIPVSKAYVPNLKPRNRHLFIVTGPAGSGKSTVARHLADRFNFPYLEGDEVSLISQMCYFPTDRESFTLENPSRRCRTAFH